MDNFTRYIDRFFDNFPRTHALHYPGCGTAHPAADVTETDDHVQLQLDVPGVRREDISITTDQNDLVISGSRTLSEVQERWRGEFRRRFRLSRDLDGTAVQAQLQDGVLTITIPRNPDATPRQIKIE